MNTLDVCYVFSKFSMCQILSQSDLKQQSLEQCHPNKNNKMSSDMGSVPDPKMMFD